MMFYVFRMKDGLLYSGFSVYGDYAPHTAMMRSFSRGNNSPTQYPHYGGQDVKYHFMFQFLVGNLEYLGLRLDLGYNLVSIMSLSGFLMVFYGISYRMFRVAIVLLLWFSFSFSQRNCVLAVSVGKCESRESYPGTEREHSVHWLYHK